MGDNRYLVEAEWLIPMTERGLVKRDQRIGIEAGRISFVQAQSELPPKGWEDVRHLGGPNRAALPGFVNLHNHLAMTLMRGYADDMRLMEWLEQKIWPLEEHLAPDDVYWGTLLACVEQLRGGITTCADMYFFMEEAAQAVADSGARACLSRGLIGFEDKDLANLRQSEEFFRNWNNRADGRITVWLGPHAPYTCPPTYLREVAALARELDTGIHIHVAETRDEIEQLWGEYKKSPVELISDCGLLEQPVLAAHCVHLTPADIAILEDMQGGVAHNPYSNMKLASGVAPIGDLLQAGITVGLGTDGASSTNRLSMFTEIRAATLLQKVTTGDATALPASDMLWMATRAGAQVLGLHDVGYVAPGAQADLILVDVDQPHLVPHHDILSLLAYSAEDRDVDTVFVGGRLLVEAGEFLACDEQLVGARANEQAFRLVKRALG